MPAAKQKQNPVYWRRYAERHREEIRERQAARRKLPETKAYMAAWRAAHAEYRKEFHRAYYQANREKLLTDACAYSKATYPLKRERKREQAKAWLHAHPARGAEWNAIKRARKLAALVEHVDRNKVLVRDSGMCGICTAPVDPANWHLDHIRPLSRGGKHSYANTQVSHPICNIRKNNKWEGDEA